ncbi:MAG: hypothetical protein ACO2OY_06685 [Thermodesulfobacteriaceae bacterium]|jgi:hypothetical protein
MVVFEFRGRNKDAKKCEVVAYGKKCTLKQLLIFQAVMYSLHDSTNFYIAYKDEYDKDCCMITLENDRYLVRFLLPKYVSTVEAKTMIFWFSMRKVSPMEMLLFILENASDILIKTPRGSFKISPPSGGDLVIE